MRHHTFRNHARRLATGLAFGLCLTLASTQLAAAAVLYDFSLAANGDAGPVRVVLRFDDFLPAPNFTVLPPSAAEVDVFSSGTPVDEVSSALGIDITPTATRFGVALPSVGAGWVLLNRDYPADFFVFDRTPTETGTFLSTGGLVESDLPLATRSPTVTLVVSQVPEPATMSLLALAGLGLIARRRRHR